MANPEVLWLWHLPGCGGGCGQGAVWQVLVMGIDVSLLSANQNEYIQLNKNERPIGLSRK